MGNDKLSSRIFLATAADSRFAVPLACMLRSAVDNLNKDFYICAYVMDTGLTDEDRKRVRKSIPRGWMSITYCACDFLNRYAFRVDGHVNISTYARLFIDKMVPSSINRIIYLDADTLVLRDISELNGIEMNGYVISAVQDPVAGIVGRSPEMMHWAGWDIAAGMPIFNAGVMLIDLEQWRCCHIGERAMNVAMKYPERMKWWDQCALNYVIRGDFLQLDVKWNVMPHLYYPPHRDRVIYSDNNVQEAIVNPWILHFSGDARPWRGPNRHWMETEFYRYLYRTNYKYDVFCSPWMGRGRKSYYKYYHNIKRFYSNMISKLTS